MKKYRILLEGSIGQDVRELQQQLNKHLQSSQKPLVLDGVYGKATKMEVISFQQRYGLQVDGICGSEVYGALGLLPPVKKDQPIYLMIHCSATLPIPRQYQAKQICDYHLKVLKWDRPGYSRIIELDGTIINTWELDLDDGFQPWEVTYGAAEFNAFSIHYCLVGGIDGSGKPRNTTTQEQRESLLTLVKSTIEKCPDILVGGHNQFHNKACPSFWVPSFLEGKVDDKNIFKKDKFGYENILNI